MGKTKIEWSDMSWPVVTGCSHAGSPGCDMCYAARMAATRLKHHPRYEGLATIENGKVAWAGEIRLNHDVLEQPLHWKKPRMIFVASMGDLLHENVPTPFIADIWDIMAEAHQHTFQILTKRADRLLEVFHYLAMWKNYKTPLSNVWLGVSVENQAAADERIPLVLRTPAAVHYVSVEPMLGAIDLYTAVGLRNNTNGRAVMAETLDWVICGGESGPGARPPNPDWVRSLRDQCQAAGVPFFFKSWGAWLHGSQFALKSPWAELRRDGARVHGRPVNWHYKPGRTHHWPDGSTSYRVGKKRAGHLLDGRAWQEFPK